jgi:hypothetical protein
MECCVVTYSFKRVHTEELRAHLKCISDARKSFPSATRLATCFRPGILLGLFDPEDGADIFLRNVGLLSTDYTALYPRRQNSSFI